MSHFFFAWAGALLAVLFGDVPLRPNFAALWRAFRQLPQAMRSRWRARGAGARSATPKPSGVRWAATSATASPPWSRRPSGCACCSFRRIPICPPVHGGGVFMYQTLREMAKLAEVHVVELLDWPWQEADNEELRAFCASAEWLVRPSGQPKGMGSLQPHAVREFANDDLDWLIHRQIYLQADRRAAARIHADGAVPRRVPPDRHGAVRARRLLPIHRRAAWAT